MKIVAKLGALDEHGCRKVGFEIESGGHVTEADTYEASELYLRSEHAEMILRSIGGHSFGFVGELEVRHE